MPLAAHVVLDYVLAAVLIAMPFIAGFSDETAPTAFFIALGALHLLVTIGTRFKKDDRHPREGRRQAIPGGSVRAGPGSPEGLVLVARGAGGGDTRNQHQQHGAGRAELDPVLAHLALRHGESIPARRASRAGCSP